MPVHIKRITGKYFPRLSNYGQAPIFSLFVLFFLVIGIFLTIGELGKKKNPFGGAQTAQVLTVNVGKSINPFSKNMLGAAFVNWDHSWGKPFPNAVPGLSQAMREAGVPLIRYAGGLWANSVGFDPASTQRTPYTAWTYGGNTYYFSYGTDEIDSVQAFAQSIGADIMIQANISNNDPAMWANLIRYTNAPGKYPVQYVELGNELDFDQDHLISFDEYARRAIAYQDAIAAIDPTVKVVYGVPAAAVSHTGTNRTLSGFLTVPGQMAKNANKPFPVLSYHWYMQCNTTSLADVLRYRFYNADGTPIDPFVWNNSYSRYWADYIPTTVKTQVLDPFSVQSQGITELNVDACNFDNVYNGNHINSLWFSDVLGRLAYSGLDYATTYTGYGAQGYAIIYPDSVDRPTRMFIRPSYYAFYMYNKYFGDTMVESSSYKNDDISIWASLDSKNPGKLKLRITNMTANVITTPVNLTGFTASTGAVYALTSTNPTDTSASSNKDSANTRINGIKLDAMNVAQSAQTIQPQTITVNGNSFTRTFPAYSSTAIVLTQSTGVTSSPTTPPTPTSTRKPGDCIGVSPGVVDIADLSTLLRDYASTTALFCDFPGGGIIGEIDIYDLSLILTKYEG